LSDAIYTPPATSDWEEAWKRTEQLLCLMNVETKARGCQLVVATLTNPIQVLPDTAAVRDYMVSIGVSSLSYADERIAAVGVGCGFTVITLAEPLWNHVRRTGEFLHGFGARKGTGHWNEKGHRVAGMIIAEAVERELERED
jgi:hypothetical protein